MIRPWLGLIRWPSRTGLAMVAAAWLLLSTSPLAAAGWYSSSAHGNATYGVNRSSTAALGFVIGNCTHCHEQHASIGGSEPAPASGTPSPYALFYDNNVSQTDNVCFQCHTGAGSYQSGGIVNRSYSYRAGNWSGDTVANEVQEFSFTSPTGSSHNLNDIKTFITGRWNYTANSTACDACHNPHAAQGDPANNGNGAKTAGARGFPISRPSLHNIGTGLWGLWGDTAAETMSTYTGGYQAPYRYNSATNFEPQGDTVALTAAQNTTDFVTFCTDCHNPANTTIASTILGRNLKTIDWTNEAHGNGAAAINPASDTTPPNIAPPYTDASLGTYVLSCLDCHEPHGSANVYLLRGEVNGVSPVTVTTLTSTAPGPDGRSNNEWTYLCGKCHTKLGIGDGHSHPKYLPPNSSGCDRVFCHDSTNPTPVLYTACGTCHYHGATTLSGTNYAGAAFPANTYSGHLF